MVSKVSMSHGLDVIVRFHDMRRMDELRRCIFSLVMQDYCPLTVHVVTQRFKETELHELKRLLSVYQALAEGISLEIENFTAHEPVDARSVLINIGMSKAGSRYLALLDYDDTIYPEAYKHLISELDRSNSAIAFGGIAVKHVMICEDAALVLSKRREFVGAGLRDLFHMNFCPIHSFVLDRSRIDPADLFFEASLTKFEDYDFLLRVCAKYTSSFAEINRIVGDYYFKDDGSNTVLTPATINAQSRMEWDAAGLFVERRKDTLLVSLDVQERLGVERRSSKLTVRQLVRE